MQYFKFMMLIGFTFTMLNCENQSNNSKNQKNAVKMGLEKVADTAVPVCKMTEKEQRERSQTLRKELFSKVQDVKELEDGYALKLPGKNAMIDKIHEHVKIEKECCPFFEFEITMKPDKGPVWLKFKGGKQVKEMLRADMETLKDQVEKSKS